MKIALYNQKGESAGEATLPKEIFEVKMNRDLIWQVATSQMGNRRKIIAHTKGRGDVSGGGKKPWRQKGTGRARAGSTRSPLWRHGGTTFGPTNQVVFKKNIPARMRKSALLMALSDKAKDNSLIVVEDLKLDQPKTKIMQGILDKLPLEQQNALIAMSAMDKNSIFASKNIPGIAVMQAKDLNCLDVLSFRYLIMPKESIKVIKETFLK